MRSYKAEGIILKRINFGEADRILTVFSKNHGKIKVIAKGVRRINSRRAGNLELFNLVSVFLFSGKGLDIVTEASVINSFSAWRRNLKSVGIVYYLCELVDKLTAEGQRHDEVFELLKNSLSQIREGNLSTLVLNFEKNLLRELGFGVPKELEGSKKSLKPYIEEITEKTIHSPRIIREIW